MWWVHGALSFLAEEAGAASVTGFDSMSPTPEYLAEHERRSSKVRLVSGDLGFVNPDPLGRTLVEKIGQHQVVWCSGVLYHTPDPWRLIREILVAATDIAVIGSKTIPEIPGLPQAAVFFPAMSEAERRVFTPLWGEAMANPFGTLPWLEAEWWWGLTPSALRGMVNAVEGWRVVDSRTAPWAGTGDNLLLIAERTK